ncbi:MAG: hypothetical protein JW908_00535 [Anaerolineales bacterium]|nr:hypothetical protein [Anaerolineales bacterium]
MICERLGWRIMPWEMDDLDLEKVRTPMYLLDVYRLFSAYGKDIKVVDKDNADLVAWIEKMRQERDT